MIGTIINFVRGSAAARLLLAIALAALLLTAFFRLIDRAQDHAVTYKPESKPLNMPSTHTIGW